MAGHTFLTKEHRRCPRGPYELKDLILGFAVHMIVVGLPIAFSIRRFSR
jgi:hypothetical protein